MREREAEIPSEYQDCRCRRRAQRSTLSASVQQIFNPCTTLFTHLKAVLDWFKCQGCGFFFISCFICRSVKPQNNTGRNSSFSICSFCISPSFSTLVLLSPLSHSFFESVSTYIQYIDYISLPLLPQVQSVSVYTHLLWHPLYVNQIQIYFIGIAVIKSSITKSGYTMQV